MKLQTQSLTLIFPFFLMLIAPNVQADVYKCVDKAGHVTYTNTKTETKGCTLLERNQAVSTVPGRSTTQPASETREAFPRVSNDAQRQRDQGRRDILEQELATEEQNLARAREALAAQESIRLGDERNYQRTLDRLQPYKDRIILHERNIEALKKEISGLK